MDNTNPHENTSWLDNLRVIATISVVLLHVAAAYLPPNVKINSSQWWTANVYDSLVRFSVPVFVMITGALLLNKEYPLGIYLKKRVTRILFPFLFWMLIYYIHAIIVSKNSFELSFQGIAKIGSSKIITNTTYHFWYISMIIGIYLFIPIIAKWARKATEKEILYFLLLWLVATILSNKMFSKFTADFDLQYFSGFIGYVVLGSYLSLKDFNKIKHIRLISFGIFCLGVLLTIFGTFYLSQRAVHFRADLYAYFAPNVIMAAIGLFVFVKQINITNRPIIAIRKFLNQQSFGIYFIHILVLYYCYKVNLGLPKFHAAISIPLVTLLCLSISATIIYLLRKLKLGKLIG